MRPGIEDRYIRELEPSQIGDQGRNAEAAVIAFFQRHFPNMEVRPALASEDSGVAQIERGKQIDAVAYLEGKPALGIQITTAKDRRIREEKMRQLRERPFLRLTEMKPQDPSIPRTLVYADAGEVSQFMQDHNLDQHPKLEQEILDSTIKSLQFDLTQTKNPQETQRIRGIIAILEDKKQELESRKGKPH